jgi:hypothetical protein
MSVVIADSESKYTIDAVGSWSRKFLTTANDRKVLPVLVSPAIAVILFFDTPPKILPLTKAFRT